MIYEQQLVYEQNSTIGINVESEGVESKEKKMIVMKDSMKELQSVK